MFCPHCGKEIAEGQAFCQYCGARIGETGMAGSTPGAGRSKTPWEDRRTVGFMAGLFRTLKETLFRPSDFFKKMTVAGGLTDPLLYAMIIGMAGLMVFYFWDILLHDPMQNFMTPELRAASERGMFRTLGASFAAVLTPFLVILWLFVVSGMLHLFLLLVHGAKAGFEATFRVVSYSMSPFLFLIIPVCGVPITSLWIITLAIIGLKEAHETSGGKATVAVLFPFLFCCGLFVLAVALFMGAVAASFGNFVQMYK
ncbi:MAG: YIP1 family protein [Betaproteobacteria bacterium]